MPAFGVLKSLLRPVSAAALLLTIVSSSAAQRTAAAPWREVVIDSKIVGKRTVYVATPAGYERGNSRFAVLILLDA